MPEGQPGREQMHEFQHEVGLQNRKLEGAIEVNDHGARNRFGRSASPGIKADYWNPAYFTDQPLLNHAPARIHIPTQPASVYSFQDPGPLGRGLAYLFER